MTPWDDLKRALAAEANGRGHLHVDVDARSFTLIRTPFGGGHVVVALSALAYEDELLSRDAAAAGAHWLVGGVVLVDDRWVIRHTFGDHPSAGEVRDALTFLAIAARALLALSPRRVSAPCLAHYAD